MRRLPVLSWLSLKPACRANVIASEKVPHDVFHSCKALTEMPVSYFGGSQIFWQVLTDTGCTSALAADASVSFRRREYAPNFPTFTFPA